MRSRLLAAVAACAVGGALVLLAAGRVWARTTVGTAGSAHEHLQVTGSQVAPALSACGLACLALAVALIAGQRWMRRLVALAMVMAAAATVAVALAGRADAGRVLAGKAFGVQLHQVHASVNGWWVVALVGGLLAVGGGAAVALGGSRWPGLGAKYDAPARTTRAADPEVAAWDALDQGEDPTAEEPIKS